MKSNIQKIRIFSHVILVLIFSIGLISPVQAINLDKKVFKFQKKLALAGNVDAQFKLGYMYEKGRGVSKDLNKAVQWYKKSSSQGFKSAQHRIVFLDVKKHGLKSKHRRWLKALKSDASTDDNAMFLLANLYETGIAVKADLNKARYYYKRATAKGNADAESKLFSLEQKIRYAESKRAEQKVAEEARLRAKELAKKKRQKELLAKQAKEKARQARLKKLKQLQTEKEKKRKEAEKQKLAQIKAKEKKQLKKVNSATAQQSTASQLAQKKEEDVFETELCTGKAARFRTQCQ